MPQKGTKNKPRPEISRPILIKAKFEDHSSKFALPKSSSDMDLRKLRELHEIKSPENFFTTKRNQNEINLGAKNLVTEHDKCDNLYSKSNESQDDKTDHDKRKTMYDDEEYVELEFPFAQPGKVFTTDPISGRIEQLSKKKVTLRKSLSKTEKPDEKTSFTDGPDSASHSFPKTAFSGLEEAARPQIPSKPAVDDDGYEAPFIFQRPIYMTLDSDLQPKEFEAPFNGCVSTRTDSNPNFPNTSSEKTAFNKEPRCSSSLENIPRSEQASVHVSNTENVGTPSFLFSLSSESSISNHEEGRHHQAESTSESLGKPISSFLASRLELASLKSDDSIVKNRTVSAESWTSSALSSLFADPEKDDNDDSDEWSSSSDISTDSECYYQQIDAPDMSGHASDHEYAVIDDCHSSSNQRIKRKTAKRSKSVKNAISLVVTGRSKSADSNKSPQSTPKLLRSYMQDMQRLRTEEAGSSTWDAVSTPSILKSNQFKDLGKKR